MNLWLSIGIAVAGFILGFLVGQQYVRREYRDLTGHLMDSGILLLKVNPNGFPNEDGVWEGERQDLIDLLNKFEKEEKEKKEKKANGRDL
jgi:hypothetical protein